jgi:hypothetical protein
MNWDQPLSRSLGSKSAKNGAELNTLGEALDMIDEDLPEFLRGRAHWQQARHWLIQAAETGKHEDIQEATAQVFVAFSVDGRLAYSPDP